MKSVFYEHQQPLERVSPPVAFRDVIYYCTDMLVFEVVDFSSPYHIILGWHSYVKFMVIPSYT
jgi:hypothetical protein